MTTAFPGPEESATEELLAMLEVMYLTATADGFFSAEERIEFLESVDSLSEHKIHSDQLSRLIDSWIARGPLPDVNVRLSELARCLPDETARRIAFGLALQIAESDGQYLDSENTILDQIAHAFGLEASDSEEIAHSVRMSQRL